MTSVFLLSLSLLALGSTAAEEAPPAAFIESVGCGAHTSDGRKLYQALLGTQVNEAAYHQLHYSRADLFGLMHDVPAGGKELQARYRAARRAMEKAADELFTGRRSDWKTAWDIAGVYFEPGFDLSKTVSKCTTSREGPRLQERIVYPEIPVPFKKEAIGNLVVHNIYSCSVRCRWSTTYFSLIVDNGIANVTTNGSMTESDKWPQNEMELPGWKRKK